MIESGVLQSLKVQLNSHDTEIVQHAIRTLTNLSSESKRQYCYSSCVIIPYLTYTIIRTGKYHQGIIDSDVLPCVLSLLAIVDIETLEHCFIIIGNIVHSGEFDNGYWAV
jgi:hypothetical protein